MTQHQAPEVTRELRECPNPWCDSHGREKLREAYAPYVKLFSSGYRVVCAVCPQIGPSDADPINAVTAWNTRATQPLSLTVDEIMVIARLRELLAKATKGPWKVYVPDDVSGVACVKRVTDDADGSRRTDWPAVCNCNTLPNADNAALIVEAVNALPALLDRLQSLSLPVDIDRSGLAQEVDDISYAGVGP